MITIDYLYDMVKLMGQYEVLRKCWVIEVD